MRALLACMLVTSAFVGCIGAEPPDTEPEPEDEPIEPTAQRAGVDQIPAELDEILDFETQADDGVALRGHVYLPEGEGPFATVLEFLPYWNQGGRGPSDGWVTEEDGRRTMQGVYQHLMDQGYAVAFVNTRGTGISDGCYSYMNHEKNGPDANAVVDALADEPWSNGKVGMVGVSYGAATQFAVLAYEPSEHLAASVAVSGEWDEWNFLGEWGTADHGAFQHPTYRNVMQGLGPTGPFYGQPPTANWCDETVRDATGWWTLATHGDKTPFFDQLDLREGLEETDVPFFYTFGLTDCEGGHKRQVWDLWERLPEDQEKRAMVGEWCHGYPTGDGDWFIQEHALPWFDHYLRGGPPVETGVVDYQDQQETWHEAQAWPPAGNETRLHLSDGTLTLDPDAAASSEQRMVNNDRSDPAPSTCNADDTIYTSTDDAIFVSPPLAQDVLLAGDFHVNFTATSTAPDGNVKAALYAVEGSGLCEDPGAEVRELRHGRTDLRHRGHLFQGEDFPVGEPAPMHVRGLPMATQAQAGERLVLSISAGTDDAVSAGYQPVITLHTGSEQGSFLTLPLVDGELVFEGQTGATTAPGDPALR